MEQMLHLPKRVPTATMKVQPVTAEAEKSQYQLDVFRSIQKAVVLVTAGLGAIYLAVFLQQNAWPALMVSLVMWTIASYSVLAIFMVNLQNFTVMARIWLALGTLTCFTFGFFQKPEYMDIAALGMAVVILLAIFLEPVRHSYQWAAVNIVGYILIAASKSSIYMPEFDLGVLHSLVIYGTPIAVLIIIAEMGRVTTQHFKSNLIQSEARRMQLEVQGRQLSTYAQEADAAREKAEQSDRVKSAFLASMSHELRTPLNAVINFTRFVVDGDTGEINEEQRDLLTDVVSSGIHLLNLINDVLDMSKIEAGSLNLFIEDDVHLDSILNSVLATSRGLIAEKPIRLETVIDPELPLMRCDRQRIFQILLNIMSNACKFTDQGEITLTAHASGKEVVLTVTDTGPGIAPEEQHVVFQAFKQTRAGLRQGSGTGLGLAISKNLAESHGGSLWFETELGKGSTFFVSLPIKSEALVPALA